MPVRVSEHHQKELSKFLKFFRSRLKTHLENVEADFDDTRSDCLSSEEVYSLKDIEETVKLLCHAVKANIRSELQDTINMMALLLRQIFLEAEDRDLALKLNIAIVEDKELLEQVEQLSVAEWTRGEARSVAPIEAMAKVQVHIDAKEKLKRQLHHEMEQHRTDMYAASESSKQLQEALEASYAKEVHQLQRKLEQANDRVKDLENEVESGRQHIALTPQFQTMKCMVTTKNQQLQDLRRRLQRYEPDFAHDDGETKNAVDD